MLGGCYGVIVVAGWLFRCTWWLLGLYYVVAKVILSG